MKVSPAVCDFVMGDGTEVEIALNFSGMAILEEKAQRNDDHKAALDAINSMFFGGNPSLLGYAKALYGAYLIALYTANPRLKARDVDISLQEWLDRLGDNWSVIWQAWRWLADPKVRMVSETDSSEGPDEPETKTE